MIVYHGTSRDFDSFKEGWFGYHFGTNKQAEDRLHYQYGAINSGNLIPVYLSIQNPIQIPDTTPEDNPYPLIDFFNGEEIENTWCTVDLTGEELDYIKAAIRERGSEEDLDNFDLEIKETLKRIIEVLQKRGYDGAWYYNTKEGNIGAVDNIAWIAFKPTQIKSAVGNNGEYDSSNPNMLNEDNYRDNIKTPREVAEHIYNLLTPEQQEENDWDFNEYYNTIKSFGKKYELIDINPNELKFNEDLDPDTVEDYEYLMSDNSPIPEIVIDANNEIIDGNHRAKAAMNLGRTIKAYKAIKSLQESTYKVYHGTNEKFSNFNFKRATQGIVWFTDSIDSIQKGEHGGQGSKYIMTRYITINNPAGWEEYEKYGLGQLQDMGYDGVILPQGNKTDYFVFSPKSISAKEPTGLNEDDYRGDHTAPTREDSPMHDVTNAYGEDIYGSMEKAVRYFGAHRPYDMYSIGLIQRARNKPNMPVKIYRAVPAVLTNQEKINDYEKQKAYILKTGRLPQGVDNWKDKSEYYDYISNEIDKLKSLPTEQEAKTKINGGDWVTINPAYAKEHGKSNLNNKYKVLTKTVSAKNLFTDGNDIHEWGYVE
jgi:hypothetical protein